MSSIFPISFKEEIIFCWTYFRARKVISSQHLLQMTKKRQD